MNHIDTAQYYGPDVVNELIRTALHPYPSDLVIVSKVGASRDERGGIFADDEPAALRRGIGDNLRALDLEQLGVVNLRLMRYTGPGRVLRRSAGGHGVGPLNHGLIAAVGLSNVSRAHLRHALRYTEVACVQNAFHLGDPDLPGRVGRMHSAGHRVRAVRTAGVGRQLTAPSPASRRRGGTFRLYACPDPLGLALAVAPNVLLIPALHPPPTCARTWPRRRLSSTTRRFATSRLSEARTGAMTSARQPARQRGGVALGRVRYLPRCRPCARTDRRTQRPGLRPAVGGSPSCHRWTSMVRCSSRSPANSCRSPTRRTLARVQGTLRRSSPVTHRTAGGRPDRAPGRGAFVAEGHDLARPRRAAHRRPARGDVLSVLPDDQFIAAVSAVPGIGPWTVQGALILALERGRRLARRPRVPQGDPLVLPARSPPESGRSPRHRREVAALPQPRDQLPVPCSCSTAPTDRALVAVTKPSRARKLRRLVAAGARSRVRVMCSGAFRRTMPRSTTPTGKDPPCTSRTTSSNST